MILLRFLKKLPVVLAVVAMLLGSFQTAWGALVPSSDTLKDYTPSPIPIITMKGEKNFDLKPQPGFDVTLLMNQSVHFSWNNSKIKFVIKDNRGKEVFVQEIGDKKDITLVPREIKLKAGQQYSWNVDDDLNVFKFTILDEATEKELLANLAEINTENLSPEECIVKKLAYLQMLSDEYSESFDFYWLIAQ